MLGSQVLHRYIYFQPFAKPKRKLNIRYQVFGETFLLAYCKMNITCIILSSDTEHITQGSLGFQEKSEILAV